MKPETSAAFKLFAAELALMIAQYAYGGCGVTITDLFCFARAFALHHERNDIVVPDVLRGLVDASERFHAEESRVSGAAHDRLHLAVIDAGRLLCKHYAATGVPPIDAAPQPREDDGATCIARKGLGALLVEFETELARLAAEHAGEEAAELCEARSEGTGRRASDASRRDASASSQLAR